MFIFRTETRKRNREKKKLVTRLEKDHQLLISLCLLLFPSGIEGSQQLRDDPLSLGGGVKVQHPVRVASLSILNTHIFKFFFFSFFIKLSARKASETLLTLKSKRVTSL